METGGEGIEADRGGEVEIRGGRGNRSRHACCRGEIDGGWVLRQWRSWEQFNCGARQQRRGEHIKVLDECDVKGVKTFPGGNVPQMVRLQIGHIPD